MIRPLEQSAWLARQDRREREARLVPAAYLLWLVVLVGAAWALLLVQSGVQSTRVASLAARVLALEQRKPVARPAYDTVALGVEDWRGRPGLPALRVRVRR